MAVAAAAAHVRRLLQRALQAVAPGVIGAADDAVQARLLLQQDHAAVAAGVLEHPHLIVLSAHREQGDAQEGDGQRIAALGDILCKADAGPVALEDGLFLRQEGVLIDVELVGQAAGAFHRRQNGFQDRGVEVTHGFPPAQETMLAGTA